MWASLLWRLTHAWMLLTTWSCILDGWASFLWCPDPLHGETLIHSEASFLTEDSSVPSCLQALQAYNRLRFACRICTARSASSFTMLHLQKVHSVPDPRPPVRMTLSHPKSIMWQSMSDKGCFNLSWWNLGVWWEFFFWLRQSGWVDAGCKMPFLCIIFLDHLHVHGLGVAGPATITGPRTACTGLPGTATGPKTLPEVHNKVSTPRNRLARSCKPLIRSSTDSNRGEPRSPSQAQCEHKLSPIVPCRIWVEFGFLPVIFLQGLLLWLVSQLHIHPPSPFIAWNCTSWSCKLSRHQQWGNWAFHTCHGSSACSVQSDIGPGLGRRFWSMRKKRTKNNLQVLCPTWKTLTWKWNVRNKTPGFGFARNSGH